MTAWHHQSPVEEKVGRGGEGAGRGGGHLRKSASFVPLGKRNPGFTPNGLTWPDIYLLTCKLSGVTSQGSQAAPSLATRLCSPWSLPASCLEFHDPSGREWAASKPTPRSSEGKHQTQQKPARQKQLSEIHRQQRARFLPLFSLICCYTLSAQDNVKFLKLFSPSLWKVGSREARTAWLLFQIGSQRRRRWVARAPGGAWPIRREGWTLGAREAASARIRELVAGFKWLEAAGNIVQSSKSKRWVLFLSHSSGSAQSLTSFGP